MIPQSTAPLLLREKAPMLRSSSTILSPFVLMCALALPCGAAEVVDLEGAWATDSENCGKVFTRRGGQTVLSEDSDLYGGGFTIDENRITGKMARCSIRTRRNDGNTVHLLASCATDIMLSQFQFSLRVSDQNSITRIFPGMTGIEISYYRCVF
jgi:hypothetical protein